MKLTILTFAAAVLLSGCASFEYTGRSFEPRAEDDSVAWYTAKNPVPAGKYRVIGKGILKYENRTLDSYDVEERLLEEARKRGADAVLLEKTVTENVNSYERDAAPDPGKKKSELVKDGVDAKGNKVEINSFGKSIKLSGSEQFATIHTVYAVFYKNSEDVQKLIESQEVRIAEDKENKK